MNIFRKIINNIGAKPSLNMEFKSYEGLGSVNFTDNYVTVLQKLQPYAPVESEQMLFKQTCKSLYIEDANLMIVFNDNADSILYFEVEKGNFIHNGNDIFGMGYEKAKDYTKNMDKDIKISNDLNGFESIALGFSLQRELIDGEYTDDIEFILAFSKEYTKTPLPSTNEIINYYLNSKE